MKNLYNKILVYHQAAIGDMVMALPAMQAIRANFPNSQIDLLAVSSVNGSIQRSLIEPLNVFNNTVFIEHRGSSIRRLIQKLKISSRILLGKYETVIMVTFAPKWYEYMLFQHSSAMNIISLADWSFEKGNRRHSDIFLDMLEFYGLDTSRFRGLPDLSFTDEEVSKGNEIYKSLNIPPDCMPIACCITGKKVNLYSYERYRNILMRLKEEYNIYPVFICSKDEINVVTNFINSLKDSCGGGRLTSDGNLRELICALRNCRFYLGNDSGAIHLASLAGLHCIGIYSSMQPGKTFYPLGDGHIIIQKFLECSSCCRMVCPYGDVSLCLNEISENEVIDKVHQLLNNQ